jgi:hypothetical protein
MHFDPLITSPLLLIGLDPLGVQLSFRAAVPGTHSEQSPASQCGWVVTVGHASAIQNGRTCS